ncbi:MAG: sulfurtransferase [Gemmatimonadetes bacterium]|nr:sulfurtransferase [Gemmatimonadota bacterium]
MDSRIPRALTCAIIASAAAVAQANAQAQAQQVPVVVSASWLEKNLSKPNVVVIHATQGKPDYDAGHVPGSRWLPWTSYTVSVPNGLSTQLPAAEPLDSALEAIGVRDDSHIIVSGGPIQTSARLFYTLEYYGFAGRVSFLDGGIDAWRESGRAVERTAPAAPARGSVTLRATPSRLAEAGWINTSAKAEGVAILDARLPEFFTGESSGGQPRAGHIPGAGNVPFAWLTGEVSLLRERGKLQRLFEQAGARKGQKVVTYCHIGMQGSALYLAARHLGYDAALYDGSWEEWSRKAELPIVGPVRP